MPTELWLTDKFSVKHRPYDEQPLPPTAVRAAALFSAISHGTEINLYRGTSPFQTRQFDTDLRLFVNAPPQSLYPTQMGYEWVGRVTDVGSDTSGYELGDVIHLPLPHRQTHTFEPATMASLGVTGPLPATLPPERACFLATTSIALQAIHDAHIKMGDHVLILGLGVLGLLAVRLAELNGASHITAVDPLPERRQLALTLGADQTIDPLALDVGRVLKESGRGADVAIEFSGNYAALQQAIRSVRMGGWVVAAGFYQGGAEALRLGEEWLHNRVTMVASMRGWGNAHRDYPLWDRVRLRETAIALLANGRLQPENFITHQIPFVQATTAYELINNPSSDLLKVVLRYGDGEAIHKNESNS